MSLSSLVFLALALGTAFGLGLNHWAGDWVLPLDTWVLTPVGEVFLRLIRFVVVPLVFSSLVLSLTRMGGARALGRMTARLLGGFVLTSAIGVAIGLVAAQLLQPGQGLNLSLEMAAIAPAQGSLLDWLLGLIPTNPLEALATGNLLQVVLSAVLVGLGAQRIGERAQPLLTVLESVYALSEAILGMVLNLAPLGVFALISSVVATQGLDLLSRLLVYVGGLFVSSLLMGLGYLLLLALFGINPLRLLRCLAPSLTIAFGTASSTAVLPLLLENLEEDYGLPPAIARFAIPLGSVLKKDGTAILQGFNALFIAQCFQVPLTPSLLTAIALSTFLISFSTPGVPGSALISMATVLSASGLPLAGIGLVAGVDRLTDGFKTVLNILGNASNAVLLARWEGQALGGEGAQPTIPGQVRTGVGSEAAAPAERARM